MMPHAGNPGFRPEASRNMTALSPASGLQPFLQHQNNLSASAAHHYPQRIKQFAPHAAMQSSLPHSHPRGRIPAGQRPSSKALTWLFVVLIWFTDFTVIATLTKGKEGTVGDVWYLSAVSACFVVSVLMFKRAERPVPIFRVMAALSIIFPLSPAGLLTVLPRAIKDGKPKEIAVDIFLAVVAAAVFGVRDVLTPQGAGIFDGSNTETGEASTSSLGFIIWLCVTVCAISICVGFVYRSNTKVTQKEQRSQELVQEVSGLRDELTRHQERETIAREVHDHVAHGISKIALHTNLAQMRTTDPAAAQALKDIRSLAQDTMSGLRTVVTSLRDSSSEGYTGVAPTSIVEIQKLIDDTKNDGIRLRAQISYEATSEIPAEIIQAAFRIVQEGLTNAIKHAEGLPIYVSVNCFPHAGVHIEIINEIQSQGELHGNQTQSEDPLNLSTGHGLIGMAERAIAVGGEMTSELADDVWRLRAFLPVNTKPMNTKPMNTKLMNSKQEKTR